MLTIGTGEIVQRLRRGLSLRGKVDMGLESSLIPTCKVQDLSGPPFRQTGRRWYIGILVPAVAGQQGRVRFVNPTNIDQLIDQITIRGVGAAMPVNVGTGATTATPTIFAHTYEARNMDNTAVPSGLLPIGAQVDSVTPGSIGRMTFRSLVAPAGGTIQTACEIVIPAAAGANQAVLTFEAETVNQQFNLTLSGLYYDDLPLNART